MAKKHLRPKKRTREEFSVESILAQPLTPYRMALSDKAQGMLAGGEPLNKEDFEKLVASVAEDLPYPETFREELINVRSALVSGIAAKPPNISRPETQLLWAAALLLIQGNLEEYDQRWASLGFSVTELEKAPVWKQLVDSAQAGSELLYHAYHANEVLRIPDTKFKWGAPGTGHYFDQEKNLVSVDFQSCLISGFEHARSEALQEFSRLGITRFYPDRMSEIHRDMSLIRARQKQNGGNLEDNDYLKLRLLGAEWEMRAKFFAAAEGNAINKNVQDLAQVMAQDHAYSMNNTLTTRTPYGWIAKETAAQRERRVRQAEQLRRIFNDHALSDTAMLDRLLEGNGMEVNDESRKMLAGILAGEAERLAGPEQGPEHPDSPQSAFDNVVNAISLAHYQANNLFENTAQGWRGMGVQPQWVRRAALEGEAPAANDNAPTNDPSLSADFMRLMSLCGAEGLANMRPSAQHHWYGGEHRDSVADDMQHKRLRLMETIWDEYLDASFQALMKQIKKEVADELDPDRQQEQENQQDGDQSENRKDSDKQGGSSKPQAGKGQQGQNKPGQKQDKSGSQGSGSSNGSGSQGQGRPGKSGNAPQGQQQKQPSAPQNGQGDEQDQDENQDQRQQAEQQKNQQGAQPQNRQNAVEPSSRQQQGAKPQKQDSGQEGADKRQSSERDGEKKSESSADQARQPGQGQQKQDKGENGKGGAKPGDRKEDGRNGKDAGREKNSDAGLKRDGSKVDVKNSNDGSTREMPDVSDPEKGPNKKGKARPGKDGQDKEGSKEDGPESDGSSAGESGKDGKGKQSKRESSSSDGGQAGKSDKSGQDSGKTMKELLDAARQSAHQEQEKQERQRREDTGQGNGKPSQGTKGTHDPSSEKTLSDIARGDWSDYLAVIAQLMGPITMVARILQKIRDQQIEKLKRLGRDLEMLPQGNDFNRLSMDAHRDMVIKQQTGQELEEKDIERFQKDKNYTEPTTIDIVLMVDGSGSMNNKNAMSVTQLEIAILASTIMYEAAKKVGANVYIMMWGNASPLIIAKPGDSPSEIAARIMEARKGLNSGTDLAPSVEKIVDMIANERGTKQGKMTGYTHMMVFSDGEISDKPAADIAIKTMFEKLDCVTLDFAILPSPTDHSATPMETMAQEMQAQNPAKKIGVVVEKDMEKIPAHVVTLLLEKIIQSRSFSAIQRSKKVKMFRRAREEMEKRRPPPSTPDLSDSWDYNM